jgi:SAM-dependent methyltransferase
MNRVHEAPFDHQSAWYDAIYAARGKDFAAEADRVLAAATEARGGRPPASVLDVACGTGAHLEAFAPKVDRIAGVDLHEGMLAAARRRLPGARLEACDMRRMDLGERFDLVCCLFASTGYLADEAALVEAIAAMTRHLAPGGVLIIEPPLRREDLDPPAPQRDRVDRGGAIFQRRTTARLHGEVLEIRFECSGPDDSGIGTEIHRIRLFPDAAFDAAFAAAGVMHERRLADTPPRRLLVARPADRGQ